MNARDLALELNRSERTIYRYLQDLSTELQVPVYYQDGYKMAGRPRLAPLDFTPSELIALKTALNAAPIRNTEPLNQHAQSALRKIRAGMNESSFETMGGIGQKVNVLVPAHETISQKGSLLPLIEEAVLNQATLRLTYHSLSADKPRQRQFNAYALVFRRHNWYLVGYCHERRKVIQLKVSRIARASLTGASFRIPGEFSIDRFYENAWEMIPGESAVQVKLIFDCDVARLILEARRHPSQQTMQMKDGRVEFTVQVAGYEEIGWWILSFGGAVEVLEPDELRLWVRAKAEKMARRYLNSSAS